MGQGTVTGTSPTWWNWCGNLEHLPPTNGEAYYFTPTSLDELKGVVLDAARKGLRVRTSGQRHAQPPLVASDNRGAPPAQPDCYLVDMSCYVDVGENGIELGPGANQVTLNPGIREDYLDAFLTNHNLMLQTVTAGGFFSVGGMTAVDVHGGTVDAPIFAETASSFTILGADGHVTTVDATTPPVNGWSQLQFARVSFGALGIVTRITLNVLPRPYATTLQGGHQRYLYKDKQAFIAGFSPQLTGTTKHARIETFYTPYAAAPNVPWVDQPNFLVLWWDVVDDPDPKTRNSAPLPPTACALAQASKWGAALLGGIAGYAAEYLRASQYWSNAYNPLQGFPPVPPSAFAAIALDQIETQTDIANAAHSDLWLAAASQVMFMSYFIELPDLSTAGLGMVWDALDAVARRTIQDDVFHIAAPMEFRFVKAGDSALSGAYATDRDAYVVNLDLIGFIEPTSAADYSAQLLQFFADVERDWVGMGGFPHNGKMYGFSDPNAPSGTHTAPFNPNFLKAINSRRSDRVKAFNDYRQSRDPGGVFYNDYVRQLLDA
ncbi:MAG: FAD-binding protein [Chloroflexi bacterium]|nr:FAD-binding protein [Chloroflexota bacterium]